LKKALFNDLPPSCAYCVHGRTAPDGESVLCPKRGITHAGMRCKKYEYDPLRRVPKGEPALPKFTKEEFAL
jgi:hypothetical protein